MNSILTHPRQVLVARYANAFNINASGAGWKDDVVHTVPPVDWCQRGQVFENKYELNSLANALRLAREYYTATDDLACFSASADWIRSIEVIVDTIRTQQVSE